MDNQKGNPQQNTQRPLAQTALTQQIVSSANGTLQQPSVQAEVILSANSQELANPHKTSRKLVLLISIGVLAATTIFVWLVIFPHSNATKSYISSGSGKSTVQNSSTQSSASQTPNPNQNPLNNNNSINSEVKYCTNSINASLVC